jgi:rhodanese-related sulfurtransferase
VLDLEFFVMAGLLPRLFRRTQAQEPNWIDAAALRQRLAAGEAVLLIDVRQPEEFVAPPGHLPGAVNVPLADVSGHAQQLAARHQPIVVVCKTDKRSARAAAELVAAGLSDVTVLRSGTDGWHQQGFALE